MSNHQVDICMCEGDSCVPRGEVERLRAAIDQHREDWRAEPRPGWMEPRRWFDEKLWAVLGDGDGR